MTPIFKLFRLANYPVPKQASSPPSMIQSLSPGQDSHPHKNRQDLPQSAAKSPTVRTITNGTPTQYLMHVLQPLPSQTKSQTKLSKTLLDATTAQQPHENAHNQRITLSQQTPKTTLLYNPHATSTKERLLLPEPLKPIATQLPPKVPLPIPPMVPIKTPMKDENKIQERRPPPVQGPVQLPTTSLHTTTYHDSFVKSKFVSGLDEETFKFYIDQKDVTMVLFYNDEYNEDKQSKWVKKQIVKAAEKTERYNTAFAVVNCTANAALCGKESANNIPMYKMYTKGVNVGSIQDILSADHKFLKKFIETCPVVEPDERAERVCMRPLKK